MLGQRLDVYLSSRADLKLTRSKAKNLIEAGCVLVNGLPSKPSYLLKPDDDVKVMIPEKEKNIVTAEEIPLEIVHEDNDIIAVNKPRGMVTHPAPGNYEHTLVNALLHHTHGKPVYPVHRLDKDTSGIILVAKNEEVKLALAKQFKEREIKKVYLALVYGAMKNEAGRIEARIGRHPVNRKKMAVLESSPSKRSREAVTLYKVIKTFQKYSLVEVQTKTGRTHQIRVHMTHIGHPLVGDQDYGKRKNEFGLKGQFLHAQKLGFIHPGTQKYLELLAPIPEELLELLQHIV